MHHKHFLPFIGLFLIIGLIFWLMKNEVFPSKNSSTSSTDSIPVVASFYPLAYFTQQIGGNLISVQTLVAPGLEPHDFEPTPQDIIAISKSKLFVYNGAGLETWAPRITADLPPSKVVTASEGISLLNGEAESGEEPTSTDPHVWMNPVTAIQEVENITQGLVRVDPTRETEYRQNATDLENRLHTLDQEFQTGLANCEQRTIVTSHNAFAYLAKQYNLQIESISGLSPDEEPTPQKLAEVTQFVKTNQVRYIFFESLVSPKLSQTIADETGAQTISFNPLEGLTPEEISGGQDYFTVQRQNLQNLRQALSCK